MQILKIYVTSYIRHDNPHSAHYYGNAIDITFDDNNYYAIANFILSLLPKNYGMLITHDKICRHIHIYTNISKFGIEKLQKKNNKCKNIKTYHVSKNQLKKILLYKMSELKQKPIKPRKIIVLIPKELQKYKNDIMEKLSFFKLDNFNYLDYLVLLFLGGILWLNQKV